VGGIWSPSVAPTWSYQIVVSLYGSIKSDTGGGRFSPSEQQVREGEFARGYVRGYVAMESYMPKRVVAWSQLRGSAGSRVFRIRSKGQFKTRRQAFRKYIHPLSVKIDKTRSMRKTRTSTQPRIVWPPPCPRIYRIVFGY
jgi:hypothetical protein